eukprot:4232049-Lingulodinium_polyedra.AAC.1
METPKERKPAINAGEHGRRGTPPLHHHRHARAAPYEGTRCGLGALAQHGACPCHATLTARHA